MSKISKSQLGLAPIIIVLIAIVIFIFGGLVIYNVLNIKPTPVWATYIHNIVGFERHGFQIKHPEELEPEVSYWIDGLYQTTVLSLEREVEYGEFMLDESVFGVISKDVRTDREFVPEIPLERRSALRKIAIDGIETTIYKRDDLRRNDAVEYYAVLTKDDIIFQFVGIEDFFEEILATFEFIEIVLPEKEEAAFIRPTFEALPQEVKNWVDNSLKFDMTDFANAKEFDGKQYLFVRSGTGGFRGERLIQITDVIVVEQERVVVKVEFTKPSLDQVASNDLYDLVYIEATGLQAQFVPVADEDIFITSIAGIHYLPNIVAQSREIKVFTPSPNEVVGREFNVSGVSNVSHYEVHYRLLDINQNMLDGGFRGAGLALGFTRESVIPHSTIPWRYFTFDLTVSENIVTDKDLILELYWLSPKEGQEIERVIIPLKFVRQTISQ